jgi:tight adherence protein B
MDIAFYFVLILVFLGVFGVIESSGMLFMGRGTAASNRIKQRLEAIAGEAEVTTPLRSNRRVLSHNKKLNDYLEKYYWFRQLDDFLRQSGLKINVAQYLTLNGFLLFLALIISILMSASFIQFAFIVFGALALPWYVVRIKKTARLRTIETQLPAVLEMLSQALRAGNAFSGALKVVSVESQEPIASEFRMASDEINFGASTREGILRLANRVDSMDMRFFAIAILIQSESGGNLSELLLNLSALIRSRLKLQKTVRVLAAEGRISAWIMGALPAVFGLVMLYMNYDYIAFFWRDEAGLVLDEYVLALLVVGVIWMRSIITIRV